MMAVVAAPSEGAVEGFVKAGDENADVGADADADAPSCLSCSALMHGLVIGREER